MILKFAQDIEPSPWYYYKLDLKLGGNPQERKKSRSPLRDNNVIDDWDEVQLVNCDLSFSKSLSHEMILGCQTRRALRIVMG